MLTDWDEMSILYRGPSIDASFQVSVHLAKRFQRRRFFFKSANQKQELPVLWWPCLVMDRDKMSNLYKGPSIDYSIFASQGLRFGSPFSPPLADLEYILRIRALIFHWLRLPVHVSNQKTFYTEHMLSTKCKQRCHFPFWFQ